MRVLDMHAHLSCFSDSGEIGGFARRESMQEIERAAKKEISLRRNSGIATFISCKSPQEWELIRKYRQNEELFFSFGIHPWTAGRYSVEQCMELFQSCDAVGEIGMDSVWCEVPLNVQRRQFERQLSLAARLGKPVVLHTKGQEGEIAKLVRGFPNPVCVHWYSGNRENLQKFLEMGCYFTLGPDLAAVCRREEVPRHQAETRREEVSAYQAETCGEEVSAYQAETCGEEMSAHQTGACGCAGGEESEEHICLQMVREIPADRLFVETDGISAVAWALGARYTGLENLRPVLQENIRYLAGRKKMKEDELCRKMWENLNRFLGRDNVIV